MVVQCFILRGRSNKLVIFKSRRMRLYSLLKLQKRKKRSAGSKQRKRNNACLKSAREFKHLNKNCAAWRQSRRNNKRRRSVWQRRLINSFKMTSSRPRRFQKSCLKLHASKISI